MKTRINSLPIVTRLHITICLLVIILSMSTVSKPFAQSSQPVSTPFVQASRVISYQGSVTTKTGIPLTGEHAITATLYSDQDGKTPVWSGSYKQIMENGIFSVLLGSGEFPLPKNYDLSKPLWIGIRIDNGEEMQPYSKLTGAPYAISIPDKSVTKEKLSDDVLQSITHIGGRQDPQVPFGSGNYWDEQGNNLNAGTEFIGSLSTGATTDVQIHVDNGAGNAASGRVMLYNRGNTTISPNITGGFKTNAITTSDGSIIAGGGSTGNLNTIGTSDFSTISGGDNNSISTSDGSVIGGGGDNSITTSEGSVIAGGGKSFPNAITNSIYSSIGGGGDNTITNTSWGSGFSVIGGGLANAINDAGFYHGVNVIGGGTYNTIDGQTSTIAGGGNNHAGILSFIGGGNYNFANHTGGAGNTHGVIGGGHYNEVQGEYQTIGGGIVNKIYADKSTVAGGDYNVINTGADWGAIGGGAHNTLNVSTHSTIAGGSYNTISSTFGIIGGGDRNTIGTSANGSVIAGGTTNLIDFDGNSFIGGGSNNHITHWGNSVIGGGTSNLIDGAGTATIAGGSINKILGNGAHFSTAGGGALNTIEGSRGVIDGGWENSIAIGADLSVIGGGTKNRVNVVEGVILGGENNRTTLAGQVVGGYWNETRGINPMTMTLAFGAATLTAAGFGNATFDAPLVAIGNGNGITGVRHNAFEVSYNGHSVVTDINGPGFAAGRPAIQGATYDDNIVYAWGNIDAAGGITSEFGVHEVKLVTIPTLPPRFKYLVVLDQILNDGAPGPGTQRVFTDGSVTATLEAPTPTYTDTTSLEFRNEFYEDCSTITTTKLFPINLGGVWHTAFVVYISMKSNPTPQQPTSYCKSIPHSFMFKVCGRRNADDPDNTLDK
jgi:hypothetical protein